MIHAGHRFDFHPWPQRPDGEGLGSLEQAVARWVLAHGGDARLAGAAARASQADMRGDSAWRIDDAALRESLAAMPMVGNAASRAVVSANHGDPPAAAVRYRLSTTTIDPPAEFGTCSCANSSAPVGNVGATGDADGVPVTISTAALFWPDPSMLLS